MKLKFLFACLLLSTCCLSQIQSPEIDSLGKEVMARLDSVEIEYISFEYKIEFDKDGGVKKINFLKSDCDTCDLKAIKKLSKRGMSLMKRSYIDSSKDFPNTESDPESKRYMISTTKFSIGIYKDLISKD